MNTPPTEKELKQIEKRLLKACEKYGYPNFFVEQFIKLQNKNNWLYNGSPIKGITYCFRGFAKYKKQNLINQNRWFGEKNENWDLTPAVFLGYYKATNPQNKLYIETLILKVNNGQPLTTNDEYHANVMGIIDTIKSLKKEEPNQNNKTPLILVCTSCGLHKFSYETEKTKFCPTCSKYTLFVQMENED